MGAIFKVTSQGLEPEFTRTHRQILSSQLHIRFLQYKSLSRYIAYDKNHRTMPATLDAQSTVHEQFHNTLVQSSNTASNVVEPAKIG